MNRLSKENAPIGIPINNSSVARPNSLRIGTSLATPLIFSPRTTALAELNSPDFRAFSTLNTPSAQLMLSPDFDRVLCQNFSLSPLTPTSFLNPKIVTYDEDMFANNFTKKLTEMKQEKEGLNSVEDSPEYTDISYSTQSYNDNHEFVQSSSNSFLESAPSTSNSSILPPSGPIFNSLGIQNIEGPSSVCSSSTDVGSSVVGSNCGSRSLHQIKLDRKRARNRDAARKCRERKMELITQLQKQVSTLNETNKTLQVKVRSYQNEVERLKKFVLEHIQNGCTLRN